MSFHSIDYLLFLPLVVVLHFLTPQRWRWVVLLAVSMGFYAAWRLDFLWLLWVSTLVDYLVARRMPEVATPWKRRALLGVSLTVNLGLLFTFKYFALFANTGLQLLHGGDASAFDPVNLLLPLGISFYTFQTLGYTIDVFRGRRKPETHLGYFAVYVMYFPQLLAGPIERPGSLLPQLHKTRVFDVGVAAAGGALMLIGYFKKLVIADRLAAIVPQILQSPSDHAPLTVLLAAFGEIYRYYADLSGYADIAIGSSLILGIRLTQNFNRPFSAVSVSEFWQRWHITVSRWFRDYVYLPLGRGKGKAWRKPVATFVTMVLVAMWHGAAWTWLAAGVITGLVMIGEGWLRRSPSAATISHRLARIGGLTRPVEVGVQNALNRVVLWVLLIGIGSMLSAPSWAHVGGVWMQILRIPSSLFAMPGDLLSSVALVPRYLLIAILALEAYQWLDAREPVFQRLRQRRLWISWGFYLALIAVILMFGTFDKPGFLYFNF